MARNALMEVDLDDDASYGMDGREDEQFLTFRLGGEVFAMGILGIKEILEFGRLTTVPMMPASVRGVINLRGRVVPVVDLALRFGRAATEPGRRTCIVIVDLETEDGRQDIGVVVDAVNQVLEIPKADIEPAPFFALLDELAERNGLVGRSMGMSGDYETAVMLGATHVRVGTALFGVRG